MGCSLSGPLYTSSSHVTLSNFNVEDKIGEGGFATIYRCTTKSKKLPNKSYAMKIIDIQSCCARNGGIDMLKNELSVLRQLPSHPFIVNLHYAFHNYLSCYLIFELLSGGDLRSYLTTEYHFTEPMIAYVASCLGSALYHLHSHGILHRDVKPDNIIFNSHGIPKLIDFGISYISSKNNTSSSRGNHHFNDDNDLNSLICTNCSGTRLYSAPELFTPSHEHGTSSDYWSLGLVLYEMLYLSLPFQYHCPHEFMKFATRYANYLSITKEGSRHMTQLSSTIKGLYSESDDIPISRYSHYSESLHLKSFTSPRPTNSQFQIFQPDLDHADEEERDHQQHHHFSPSLHVPFSPTSHDYDHRQNIPHYPTPNPSPLQQQQQHAPAASGATAAASAASARVAASQQPQQQQQAPQQQQSQSHYFEEFDLLILPSHLRIQFPFNSAYGTPISLECLEFLDELLDIRFNRRFGANKQRYLDYMRHSWLQQNGYNLSLDEEECLDLVTSIEKPCRHSSPSCSSPSNGASSHAVPVVSRSPSPSPPHPHSPSLPPLHPSPIRLNLEAMELKQFKRQCQQNLHLELGKKKQNEMIPSPPYAAAAPPADDSPSLMTTFNSFFKTKRGTSHSTILPMEYSTHKQQQLVAILDSYHFSAVEGSIPTSSNDVRLGSCVTRGKKPLQ